MTIIKKHVRASALALMTLAFMPNPVLGQDTPPAPRQFSAQAGAIVLEAQKLMTAEQHGAALKQLTKAQNLADITPYESATIYQMKGVSYYQLNQYGPAISAFERALASGGLQPKEVSDLKVKIAQLLIGDGQYVQGAQKLENHLNEGGALKPEYIIMLTQAWVQGERYEKALPWAVKWFDAASPKERKHFDLLNFLYHQLGQSERQIDIVKEMITLWPADKSLWESWVSLLAMNGQEKDAFDVTKQIYISGFDMSEAELMKVVQYYSYYDMPYQAAQILEKELNIGRIRRDTDKLVQLSSLFRQAREYARAIPILEAATQSDGTAALYAQLGEDLYNEGGCGRAETAFKQAINLGYEAGKAWTLIATCRYETAQKEDNLSCDMSEAEKSNAPLTLARQATLAAFENVPLTSPQSRDAKKWISFISQERETFDRRCAFEERVKIEECRKEYDRFVRMTFLGNDMKISETCQLYVENFEAEQRVKVEG